MTRTLQSALTIFGLCVIIVRSCLHWAGQTNVKAAGCTAPPSLNQSWPKGSTILVYLASVVC